MPSEISAAEANRLFYAEQAAYHDHSEYHLANPAEQEKLKASLADALEAAGPDPEVLDAGGGTGNVSGKLLDLGVNPLVVDVSPDMLERWKEKARARGAEPQVLLSTIEDFLAGDSREWDLIVFSSVLHHLEDPGAVLAGAASKVKPGGQLITYYDPTRVGRVGRFARRIDWILWETLHNPKRIPGFARNWAKRLVQRSEPDPERDVGRMAERHATTGLDDMALAERARSAGMEVVAHRRYYDARFGLTRLLFRLFRHPSNFSLTLRREAGSA